MKTTIIAQDKHHLEELISNEIKTNGNNCDLNFIHTKEITDMNNLFLESAFNGDISNWDTSQVRNMDSMFEGTGYMKPMFSSDFENNEDAKCKIPYWAKTEDKKERKKAIDNYWLHKNLIVNLRHKDSKDNKNKL